MGDRTFAERWEDCQEGWDRFRPSKPLWVWSCIGAVVATVAVGFTFGGWTTREAAQRLAREAAADARAELVAAACVRKFRQSPGFETELSALKDAPAPERPGILEKGGWVTLAGTDQPLAAAGVLCADELTKMPYSSAPIAGSPGEPAS